MQISQVEQVDQELVAAFERLMPQLNPNHPPPSRKALETIVASQAITLFVARDDEQNGKITGTLTLAVFRTPTGTHAWIEDVVVDETARGRGLGEALTRAAIDRAAALGAAHVDLTSRPSREAANRLYQRMGFKLRSTNLYRFVPERD